LCVYEAAVLDGFTIKNSTEAGIKISGGSPTINNNKTTNNKLYGIQCINQASPTITNCTVRDNGYDNGSGCAGIHIIDSRPSISRCTIGNNNGDGIRFYNSGLNLTDCNVGNNSWTGTITTDCGSPAGGLTTNLHVNIAGNKIHNNEYQGVLFGYQCQLPSERQIKILNNWIYRNGINSEDGSGIYLDMSDNSPNIARFTICGNTIAYNNPYGIEREESQWSCLDITNCIIWGNVGSSLLDDNHNVTYSCIEGDLLPGTGNINIDPYFIDVANNNYHIDPNSRCIDTGDPNGNYDGETDIDGQNRVMDGDANGTVIVDMGADEFYLGRVTFAAYAHLAKAWRTAQGDPDYDPNCDLAYNGHIDFNDLKLFCDDWLQQPGWLRQLGEDWLMGGEGMMAQGQEQMPTEQFQAEAVSQPVDLEVLAEMLDEVWASGALNAIMTEQEYLEFRQETLESLQQ
jgi:parallel beta-helix repeat protein